MWWLILSNIIIIGGFLIAAPALMIFGAFTGSAYIVYWCIRVFVELINEAKTETTTLTKDAEIKGTSSTTKSPVMRDNESVNFEEIEKLKRQVDTLTAKLAFYTKKKKILWYCGSYSFF